MNCRTAVEDQPKNQARFQALVPIVPYADKTRGRAATEAFFPPVVECDPDGLRCVTREGGRVKKVEARSR